MFQTFARFNVKLWDIMKLNEIFWNLWNFTKFYWCNTLILFSLWTFCFCFLVLSKVDCKISVSFGQIWNSKVLNLAMAKVKKVNNTVTYFDILSVRSVCQSVQIFRQYPEVLHLAIVVSLLRPPSPAKLAWKMIWAWLQ
jgi:hypothetical protein